MRNKVGPLIAIAVAVGLVVVLSLSPRTAIAPDEDVEMSTDTHNHEDIDAEIQAAVEKINSGAPMEGIMAIRELAENHPNDPRPQFYLGMFSIQSGQFDKAVNRFQRVIELDPSAIDAHRWLGESYMSLGDFENAKKSLEKFISLSDDEQAIAHVEEMLESIK
jgi:Flp pilus assembly protein TadD